MADGFWSGLTPRKRGLLIAAAAAETSLKAAALADMRRRPSAQIRGSKWIWVPTVILGNSFGLAPLAYFVLGRKKDA